VLLGTLFLAAFVLVWAIYGRGRDASTVFNHGSPVDSIVISSDSQTLISGGYAGLKSWSLQNGSLIKSRPGVCSVDGSSLAGWTNHDQVIWVGKDDLYYAPWRNLKESSSMGLMGMNGRWDKLAISDSGKEIAISSLGSLLLYDIGQRQPVDELHLPSNEEVIYSSILNQSKLYVLVRDYGRQTSHIRVWNRPGKMKSCDDEISFVEDSWWMCLSADGRHIACGCFDHINGTEPKVLVWDLSKGKNPIELKGHEEVRAVTAVSFSPDGKFLASAGGFAEQPGKLIVWAVGSWSPICSFEGHAHQVKCISWFPDSKRLATGGLDGTIRLWNLPQEE
jgi:WD40 repeat protein